jgi:hypothetical protein
MQPHAEVEAVGSREPPRRDHATTQRLSYIDVAALLIEHRRPEAIDDGTALDPSYEVVHAAHAQDQRQDDEWVELGVVRIEDQRCAQRIDDPGGSGAEHHGHHSIHV